MQQGRPSIEAAHSSACSLIHEPQQVVVIFSGARSAAPVVASAAQTHVVHHSDQVSIRGAHLAHTHVDDDHVRGWDHAASLAGDRAGHARVWEEVELEGLRRDVLRPPPHQVGEEVEVLACMRVAGEDGAFGGGESRRACTAPPCDAAAAAAAAASAAAACGWRRFGGGLLRVEIMTEGAGGEARGVDGRTEGCVGDALDVRKVERIAPEARARHVVVVDAAGDLVARQERTRVAEREGAVVLLETVLQEERTLTRLSAKKRQRVCFRPAKSSGDIVAYLSLVSAITSSTSATTGPASSTLARS